MRHKDPELMRKIHDYAEEYYFSKGYSPATSEIAAAIGISRTTAYNYLIAMDKIDMIDYDGKLISTEKMRKSSEINRSVGIYDTAIPCGELETIEAAVSELTKCDIIDNGKTENKTSLCRRNPARAFFMAGGELCPINPNDRAVIPAVRI